MIYFNCKQLILFEASSGTAETTVPGTERRDRYDESR